VLGDILLHVPGRHNVLNALAVVAICLDLGMPFATIASGLAQYRGVKRRFEIRWRDDSSRRMIVDDYGHHPTEIEATLAAARQFWQGRVVAVFQPHRYSRTLHCRDGFLRAFHGADVVLLTDIYAAGEAAIEGVTSESLVEEMRRVALPGQQILHVGGLEAARDHVTKISSDGDLVLCLGAGTITRLPELLIQSMQGA
jgi:UDP-N-acetylmuramate--alanine ligase